MQQDKFKIAALLGLLQIPIQSAMAQSQCQTVCTPETTWALAQSHVLQWFPDYYSIDRSSVVRISLHSGSWQQTMTNCLSPPTPSLFDIETANTGEVRITLPATLKDQINPLGASYPFYFRVYNSKSCMSGPERQLYITPLEASVGNDTDINGTTKTASEGSSKDYGGLGLGGLIGLVVGIVALLTLFGAYLVFRARHNARVQAKALMPVKESDPTSSNSTLDIEQAPSLNSSTTSSSSQFATLVISHIQHSQDPKTANISPILTVSSGAPSQKQSVFEDDGMMLADTVRRISESQMMSSPELVDDDNAIESRQESRQESMVTAPTSPIVSPVSHHQPPITGEDALNIAATFYRNLRGGVENTTPSSQSPSMIGSPHTPIVAPPSDSITSPKTTTPSLSRTMNGSNSSLPRYIGGPS